MLVRDEASLRLCQSHGLTAEERPDDGFRLREVMDFGPEPPPSSPHRIGVCIFPQHSPRWSSRIEDWWTDCLRALARSLPDCRIEGFCFHTNRDMDFETTRQLFVRAGLDPNGVQPPTPDFRAAITQLRNFSALISTRFHSVVTASVLKIPCVAIALDDYYEVKMRSVIREASSPILLVNPIQSAPEAAVRFFHERIQGRANRPR